MGCKRCGECCKYTAIATDTMSEDALRWAEYHDHTIVEREGKLIVFVPNRCKQLADDNTCKIYDDRPDVCAKIPNRDCAIFQPEGCRYFE